MFEESLIPQEVLLPIQLTIKFALLNSPPEAPMMNEMPTIQFPQKSFLFIGTHDTLQLLNLDVQLFALNNVPSGILAEKTGQGGHQEIGQPSCRLQLGPDEALLTVLLLFHLAVLAFPPFLLSSVLADKGVLDMPAQLEAVFTQSDIFTMHAFVDGLAASDLPELTPVTVVVELLANLLVDLLFFEHILLLPDLPDDIRRLFITAKRAFHHIVVLHLMPGPLAEALEVKGVVTDGVARGGGVAFHDLHMADGAEKVLILVILFNDHIFPVHLDLGVLQKFLDLIIMDPPVGDDIPELLIIVDVSKQKVMVFGQVEDIGENVQGMHALLAVAFLTGAFQLVADGYLEFGAMVIFQDKAGPSCNADDVIFLLALQELLYLLYLELDVLLWHGF